MATLGPVDVNRVILVDDHEMVLEGLVSALSIEADVEVVATARSVAEFERVIEDATPDVVVTDWQLPDGTGTDVAAATQSSTGDVAVLMISGFPDDEAIRSALDAGCSGFVAKGAPVGQLVDAIRSVHRGAAVFPAALLGSVVRGARAEPNPLTSREHEILGLLAAAKSVDEIATELYLSIHTVRNHVRAILSKLMARSQLEAVIEGVRAGLVEVR